MTATAKPRKKKPRADGAHRLDDHGVNGHPVSNRLRDRSPARPSSALPPFDDPDRARRPITCGSEAIAIPIGRLVRHPDNRQPTPEQVGDMRRRINADGQLEPLVVRELPIGHKHRCGDTIDGYAVPDEDRVFQIISGETRALAQLQRHEERVVCRLIENADDADALRLLAEFNAGRHDLNPIQKARLIQRLMAPVEDGGAGLSAEEAGAVYGLESRSGAINLVRLLDLPAEILQLVESGDLPQTFAREAIPYCQVPAIAAELVDLVAAWKGDPPDRVDFLESLADVAGTHTRSMKPADRKRLYDRWSIEHCSDRLFDADEATLAQLGVISLVVDYSGQKKDRATNVKLWDSLQKPAIAAAYKKLEGKAKSKANAAAASDDRSAKRERTPAEQEALEKDQDEQLEKRIRNWRHAWLRELIAGTLRQKVPNHWVLVKIVLWCLGQRWAFHAHNQLQFDELVVEITGKKSGELEDVLTEQTATLQNLLEAIARAIATPEKNPDCPVWPFDFVEQIAVDLGIDLADQWGVMQAISNGSKERFETFFALHNSRQLRKVATELGVYVSETTNKSAAMRILAGLDRVLKLPKSIAAVGKVKRRSK